MYDLLKVNLGLVAEVLDEREVVRALQAEFAEDFRLSVLLA